MPLVLVVADEPWIHNEVHGALALPGYTLADHSDPASAAAAVLDTTPDAVIVDLQIGAMGGMAVTRAIRQEEIAAGAVHVPIVMLLDRRADAFLARRAGAGAWLQKPFEAHELRDAIDAARRAIAAAE